MKARAYRGGLEHDPPEQMTPPTAGHRPLTCDDALIPNWTVYRAARARLLAQLAEDSRRYNARTAGKRSTAG
jgi:hypothetical protein